MSRAVPAILLTLLVLLMRGPAAQGQVSAEQLAQKAISLEQAGRDAEALAAWQAFVRVQPSNGEAYAHMGLLEARQGRYTQAAALYRKALALSPSLPGLRMNLGLALFKAGQLKEAVGVFQALAKGQAADSPESLRLSALMGLAQYGLQDYAATVPLMKRAAAGDPQNLEFRLVLAHSCLYTKQYQCVLDTYHEILNLNAESAEADMLAGEALDEMNDRAAATEQFRAAVKANPKEPGVHFGLGYLLWTQSQYEDAAQEFQAELANVPAHAQAMAYLADSYLKLNRPDDALPLAKKAAQLDPKMELAHLALGAIYAGANKHEEALRELRLAAQLKPDDVNVHWRLARLLQAMGRKEEATVEFQKTTTLTKQADESVMRKMGEGRAPTKPVENPPAQ